MAHEAEELLQRMLDHLQQHRTVRRVLSAGLLLALCVSTLWFLYNALPRQYELSIADGEIVSNRHFLTTSLQQEAQENHISLRIRHVENSEQALQLLNQGKLDFAFIQAGFPTYYPNVVQVATVAPEILHVLVKPNIHQLKDLNAHLINLGNKQSETRLIAKRVLEYSGLLDEIDYVESNYSDEELMAMRPDKLPDVIFNTSYLPSMVADFFVRERGYALLEIPFPAALSLRYGWAEQSKILADMYNAMPAVPARDISTVGINLHLLSNRNVDEKAIYQVLKALYGPALAVRLKMKFSEDKLTLPSGYPLASGAKTFLERNNPLVSAENFEKLKAITGLILSLASTAIVIVRWLRGNRPD
jgi:TRAP-type uncharacterized transport system substrate-binding protein